VLISEAPPICLGLRLLCYPQPNCIYLVPFFRLAFGCSCLWVRSRVLRNLAAPEPTSQFLGKRKIACPGSSRYHFLHPNKPSFNNYHLPVVQNNPVGFILFVWPYMWPADSPSPKPKRSLTQARIQIHS
jgi:hypothetical protein